jgi:hypothetical protein
MTDRTPVLVIGADRMERFLSSPFAEQAGSGCLRPSGLKPATAVNRLLA